jgi:hypothetical protein
VIDRTQLTEALAWWVDVVADVQTDTFTLTMSRTMARRTLSALERLLDFPTDEQVEAAREATEGSSDLVARRDCHLFREQNMTETTTWQEQFKEAVGQYVIERGWVTLGDDTDTRSGYYGGPYDFEATYHLRPGGTEDDGLCSVVKWSDLREDEWDQFAGTFNDSDHNYGISVKIEECACGKLNGRRLLHEARFGDVLRHLVGFGPE